MHAAMGALIIVSAVACLTFGAAVEAGALAKFSTLRRRVTSWLNTPADPCEWHGEHTSGDKS